MPIFDDKPRVTPPPVVETVTQYGTPETAKNFVTSLEGTIWKTNLYRQILREDDVPRTLDTVLDATVQQYQKINNYELMIQGELDYSEENGITIITGEALLYPGTVVNDYDVFVAELSDNGLYIFHVKEATRLTYHASSVYSISFELFDVASDALLANLTLKTVEELYFHNADKTISNKPRNVINGRQLDIMKMITFYNDEFYDLETETLLVPDENYKVYDPFITEFWASVIPRHIRGRQPKPTIYKANTGEYRKRNMTIWDNLMTGTCIARKRLASQMETSKAAEFSSVDILYSIATTPIDLVVWPTTEPSLQDTNTSEVDTAGDYYVLSKAFYEGDTANFSPLDKLVNDFLHGIYPNVVDMIAPINALAEAEPLVRFYQLPVYVALLKLGG